MSKFQQTELWFVPDDNSTQKKEGGRLSKDLVDKKLSQKSAIDTSVKSRPIPTDRTKGFS